MGHLLPWRRPWTAMSLLFSGRWHGGWPSGTSRLPTAHRDEKMLFSFFMQSPADILIVSHAACPLHSCSASLRQPKVRLARIPLCMSLQAQGGCCTDCPTSVAIPFCTGTLLGPFHVIGGASRAPLGTNVLWVAVGDHGTPSRETVQGGGGRPAAAPPKPLTPLTEGGGLAGGPPRPPPSPSTARVPGGVILARIWFPEFIEVH